MAKKLLLLILVPLILLYAACAAPAPPDHTAAPPAAATPPPPPAPSDSNAGTTPLPQPTPPDSSAADKPADSAPLSTDEQQTASPAPADTAAPGPAAEIVLTINGDGVSGETSWTLSQLQALSEGYRATTYSTTNNWPSYGFMAAEGVALPYLLRQAGLSDTAASFKLIATDGYYATVTYQQMFGERYAYGHHSAAGSSDAVVVEPLLAWAWGEDSAARPEALRPVFGQAGPQEVNTAAFVKNLCQIEVQTAYAGNWPAPSASLASGSTVAAGSTLELWHDNRDIVRIYYTLDGSQPDYHSAVYNPSTSYFQPHLTVPLTLTEDTVIKAFAAGLGKEPSPVVTFTYTVE